MLPYYYLLVRWICCVVHVRGVSGISKIARLQKMKVGGPPVDSLSEDRRPAHPDNARRLRQQAQRAIDLEN